MKTQKRKRWLEGTLSVSANGHKISLFNDSNAKVDEHMIRRDKIVADAELETDRHLIEVLVKTSNAAVVNQNGPNGLVEPQRQPLIAISAEPGIGLSQGRSLNISSSNTNFTPPALAANRNVGLKRSGFKPPGLASATGSCAVSAPIRGKKRSLGYGGSLGFGGLRRSDVVKRSYNPPPTNSDDDILAMLEGKYPSSIQPVQENPMKKRYTTSRNGNGTSTYENISNDQCRLSTSATIETHEFPDAPFQPQSDSVPISGFRRFAQLASEKKCLEEASINMPNDGLHDNFPDLQDDASESHTTNEEFSRPIETVAKCQLNSTSNNSILKVRPSPAPMKSRHSFSVPNAKTKSLLFPNPCLDGERLKREYQIPATFSTDEDYKIRLQEAIIEHLHVQLSDVADQLQQVLGSMDTSEYLIPNNVTIRASKGSQRIAHTGPKCKCVPASASKMVAVRKEGKNHGRRFYSCAKPRGSGCKFFLWADQGSENDSSTGAGQRKVSSAEDIERIINVSGLKSHIECSVVENPRKFYQRAGTKNEKTFFVQVARRGKHSDYAKRDLWALAQSLEFRENSTCLAESVYFGPNADGIIELKPRGPSPFSKRPGTVLYALNCFNADTEFSWIDNLDANIKLGDMPILPNLIQSKISTEPIRQFSGFSVPRSIGNCRPLHLLAIARAELLDLSHGYVEKYTLNDDQASALVAVAKSLPCSSDDVSTDADNRQQSSVVLVHGVFGSGKSYFVAVLIMFLDEVFNKSFLNAAGEEPSRNDWKVFLSSSTNIAVDRILLSLLELGFSDFVRVGSARRITPRLLPHSTHGINGDKSELNDLKAMLKEDGLSYAEKRCIQESIGQLKRGENDSKILNTRVVASTLASTTNECLQGIEFAFQIQDEACQMTEPSALLPIAKFKCRNLVCVGDPKQLCPTISTNSSHNLGLEQSLFERLSKTIPRENYIILKTQYRCHPQIANISNSISYDGVLINGVSAADREALIPGFQPLRFYDVTHGNEVRRGQSFINEEEAFIIVKMVELLVDCGIDQGKVGVITTYKAQAAHIHELLKSSSVPGCVQVLVSTVDAFQGGEREIVFLSSVKTKNTTFIDDNARTNVAISRAKRHLLIVGKWASLQSSPVWRGVLTHCAENMCRIESRVGLDQFSDYIESFKARGNIHIDENHDDNNEDEMMPILKRDSPQRNTPQKQVQTEFDLNVSGLLDDDSDSSQDEIEPHFKNPMVVKVLEEVSVPREDNYGDSKLDTSIVNKAEPTRRSADIVSKLYSSSEDDESDSLPSLS